VTGESKLKVFTTQAHQCSYLPDKSATTLFIDPATKVDKSLYSRLSEIGFRRSGKHLYTPNCSTCAACVPVRVDTENFKPTRRQKRIIKRNQDLSARLVDSIHGDEYYSLYKRYISRRHHDGDMHPPSREQYESFLSAEWGVTQYISFNYANTVLAIMVVDVIDNGISAVYTFFEPDQSQRSLGSYAILWQIQYALNTLNLPYVYLGYWIQNCVKMNYKTQYQPIEYFSNGQWVKESG